MATAVKPNQFSISSFVAAIDKSGARSNLFEVDIKTPTSISDLTSGTSAVNVSGEPSTQWRFLVNATTLPGYTVGEIAVPYFGRNAYFAGDTTFGDWTVTVLNDEDMRIRKGMEVWIESINNTVSNTRDPSIAHSNIVGTASVKTYGLQGGGGLTNDLDTSQKAVGFTQVDLFDVWPSNISPIDLSQDAANTIETFQVTWQYNYLKHSSN